MTSSIFMQSPPGPLLICAVAEGITRVHFLTPGEINELSGDFGRITPSDDCTIEDSANNIAIACYSQLKSYFEGTLKQFDVPLAQHGTPFQTKVWEQLTKISYGNTVSYLTIAKRLGDPKTIRAAASANGKNNIAIIVPCHRVIGSSGALTGYAGGLHRKKWLLEHEQKFAHGFQTLF